MTTPGSGDPVFTALWEAHRRRMLDLAFRMLLHFPDAEDVVQEAFGRLARTDIAGIDDPEGWLVVVTSRLCLDRLRTRRRRPTDELDLADDPFTHPIPRTRWPSSTTSAWRCMPSWSA
jgi:DNA-directed RNA polymerase specialized sigma24 family protein